ncbi:DinB family protein [Virgibacillus sp. DJP39]|uniref:DinB family protein n=1 Tax=Virgibacillus sp. DJP39 TaxID=3409790 RepID=UPI003BB7BAB6
MIENLLFKQMIFVRKRTIASLEATSEQFADEIPSGVKNSIRWNLGHILVSQDNLLYPFIGETHHVPKHYLELFQRGTSPDEWEIDYPSLSEIRGYLVEQPNRIKETFDGMLDKPIQQPVKFDDDYELTSLGDLLSFTIWHEGLHQGAINTIKRAVGIEDLWSKVPEGK